MSEEKLDSETRILAAMAYGESSPKNIADEMSALVRQRDARGYADMNKFVISDKTFSFVVKDGNPRYNKLMKATETAIAKDAGMAAALVAAKNALAGGKDLSNGGCFWDGGISNSITRNTSRSITGSSFPIRHTTSTTSRSRSAWSSSTRLSSRRRKAKSSAQRPSKSDDTIIFTNLRPPMGARFSGNTTRHTWK